MNLRAERLNRGLSEVAAAAAIGIARGTLKNAEAGGPMPQAAKAKAIADFYGVRVTDIWPVTQPAEEAA